MRIKKVNNLLLLIRTKQWWHAVLAFLLGLTYIFIYKFQIQFDKAIKILPIIIFLVLFTAITGYLINNLTDYDEDIHVKKKIANIGKRKSLIIFIIIINLIAIYIIIGKQNTLWSLFLYLLQFLLFILYSVKPFRLKKHRYLSILLDSLYNSTVFSIFILSFFIPFNSSNFTFISILFLYLWIRGIKNYLSHLIDDRKYDIKINKTIVHVYGLKKIFRFIIILFVIEFFFVISFFYTISKHFILFLIGFIVIYFFRNIVYALYKKQFKRLIIYFRYVLNDFYENWLPIFTLIMLSLHEVKYIILLVVHLIVFPNTILQLTEFLAFFYVQIVNLLRKSKIIVKTPF